MTMLKNTKSDLKFVSILADATMRLPVPEDTEGAVRRDYETSDGKTGTKYELVFTELSGLIDKIAFYDGEYAKLLQLTFKDPEDEEAEPVVLSVSTASTFGEDIMKKLLNIDRSKPVRLVPYSFEDDKKKVKKGVTIYQEVDGEQVKLENYFYDKDTKKVCNGYPEIPAGHGKKPVSKDEWKIYFATARLFLVNTLTEKLGIETEEREPSIAEGDFADDVAPELEEEGDEKPPVEGKGMDPKDLPGNKTKPAPGRKAAF